MDDESKPKVPPPSLNKPKPPSQPLPDPPTDAPPPDPATTPDPHVDPGATASASPPPEEKREVTPVSTESGTGDEVPAAGATAPLDKRLLAGLIDGLVAVGLSLVVTMIAPGAVEGVLSWLVSAAYWIARDSLSPLKGQSLGKSALGIKVVKVSGGNLVDDWKTALIRNAILVVPFVGLIVELIVMIVRKDGPDKGKRLGDDWANTRVVIA